MVKRYLDSMEKTTAFKDNLPCEDWLTYFKHRWNDRIRLRKPDVLIKAHALNLNEKTLDSFFCIYHTLLSENGFVDENYSSDRIFNANETGLSMDPNKRKLYFKKPLAGSYILTPISG